MVLPRGTRPVVSHRAKFSNTTDILAGGILPFSFLVIDKSLRKFLPLNRVYIHNYTPNMLNVLLNQEVNDVVPVPGYAAATISEDGLSSIAVVNTGLVTSEANMIQMICWREGTESIISLGY